jgi:hypothetical protein
MGHRRKNFFAAPGPRQIWRSFPLLLLLLLLEHDNRADRFRDARYGPSRSVTHDAGIRTASRKPRRVSDFGADALTQAVVVFHLYLVSIFPSHAMTRMLALRTF